MRVGAWLIGHAHGAGADIASGSAVSPAAAATGWEARAATFAPEQAADAPGLAVPEATGPAELAGMADLHAALRLVSSGQANSVTLCGFGSGQEVLRVARELAGPGMVVEPLVRHGGGGIDVRVRRAIV